MNREGVSNDLLPKILSFLKTCPKIMLEGVMFHLFSANTLDIEKQVSRFKMMYDKILDSGYTPKYRHIGTSIGILKLQDPFFNAYRPGLALYGYNPLDIEDFDYEKGHKLQPALSMSSIITAINSIPYNEGVSYDPQWKQVEKTNKITVTISFGYAEGMPRAVREKIDIHHESGSLKQIGNVCMNLSCYAGNEKILLGDEVFLLERDQSTSSSVSGRAKATETIPYEILVHLDKGIRRENIE